MSNQTESNLSETIRYSEDHEWAFVEEGVVIVGITDYAQEHLGEIVFLEIADIMTNVEKGEEFGTIESVKAVSQLLSPVTGKIVAVNDDLANSPEKINQAPYESWIIKLTIEDDSQLQELLTWDDYQNILHA